VRNEYALELHACLRNVSAAHEDCIIRYDRPDAVATHECDGVTARRLSAIDQLGQLPANGPPGLLGTHPTPRQENVRIVTVVVTAVSRLTM
jgi:hypothetical protein